MREKSRTYRGVAPAVQEAIKDVAVALDISANDLVQEIFLAALAELEEGKLILKQVPTRLTLFPPDGEPGWSYDPNRTGKVPPLQEQAPQPQPQEWRSMASYRVSDTRHQALKTTAQKYGISVGNLANYFLEWGLDAHQRGAYQFGQKGAQRKHQRGLYQYEVTFSLWVGEDDDLIAFFEHLPSDERAARIKQILREDCNLTAILKELQVEESGTE